MSLPLLFLLLIRVDTTYPTTVSTLPMIKFLPPARYILVCEPYTAYLAGGRNLIMGMSCGVIVVHFASYYRRFHHTSADVLCECGQEKSVIHFAFCRLARDKARPAPPPRAHPRHPRHPQRRPPFPPLHRSIRFLSPRPCADVGAA